MVWLAPSTKSGPKIPDIAAVRASKLAYFGIFRLSRKSCHFLQILGVKSLILGHADPGHPLEDSQSDYRGALLTFPAKNSRNFSRLTREKIADACSQAWEERAWAPMGVYV